MRIMATGAIPLLDRRMDDLIVEFLVVAIVAKLSDILDRLEFMGSGRFVAICALIQGHRTMDKFLLAHLGVALGRNTRFLFNRFCYSFYISVGLGICGGCDIGTYAAVNQQ